MFESMKMFLKGKIESSTEVIRIQTKLHKFLTSNADVDHYLCEKFRRFKIGYSLYGFLIGFMIALIIFGLLALFVMYYWHALGYLHVPGSIDLA